MKVYIITKGEYSDYRICCVATNKERAEFLRKYFSDDWRQAEIETYDTDDFAPVFEGNEIYRVTFNADGTAQTYKVDDPDCYDLSGKVYSCRAITDSGEIRYIYNVTVFARDSEHAIKIASDILAEWKYRKQIEEQQ